MRSHLAITLIACLLPAALAAQAPFPAGLDGELYFAPRIDLVPAADGGPYTVTLDGRLNDPVWQRAAFHTVNTVLDSAQPLDLDPPTDDWDMIFACAADQDFLYVAWKIVDDTLISHEQTYCDVWQDDSIEIYIDGNNDGPNCTSGPRAATRSTMRSLPSGSTRSAASQETLTSPPALRTRRSRSASRSEASRGKARATSRASPGRS
jgi:hypothetical protein